MASSVSRLPAKPAEIKPLAPERFKVQFTVDRDTYDKLRQVQDLLRHSIPNGDPAAIFDRALTLLLADLSKTKFAAANRPPAGREVKSPARDTFLPRSSAKCGAVMVASAHSVAIRGAATKRAFSSSIMSCLTPREAQRRVKISNCAAVHIMCMKQSSNSRIGRSRCSHVKRGPDYRTWRLTRSGPSRAHAIRGLRSRRAYRKWRNG